VCHIVNGMLFVCVVGVCVEVIFSMWGWMVRCVTV